MSEQLGIDEIVLNVPASAAYTRIVRVGAAALALRQGMSFTEIDELRGAIDKALALLLDPPAKDGTAISCRFRTGPTVLELEARRTDGAALARSAAAALSEAVSQSGVVADVEFDRVRLLLRKRGDHPNPRQPR